MRCKRLLSFILSVLLILSVVPMGLFSITASADGGRTGDCFWQFSGTVLTISGNGKMAEYSSRSAPWESLKKDITRVVIEDGVTYIGNRAFEHCSALTSITLADSVKSIGFDAFVGCAFTNITIPDSVTEIGRDAFAACTSIKKVCITDIAAWCSISFRNGNANPLSYAHNLYLNGKLLTDIVIPEGVVSIGWNAFNGGNGLKSIAIPNTVKSIGGFAFANCYNLTSIKMPSWIASLGDGAFYGCTSLTSIKIPAGVTSIGSYTFSNCFRLESISLGSGITSIPTGTFGDSSSIKKIYIPKSVKKIYHNAFSSVNSIEDIYYEGTESEWQSVAIQHSNGSLTKARLHYNCLSLPCMSHSYFSNYEKVNDSTHKRVCAACGYEETAGHTWNGGTVTKQATCKESGTKHFTCTACSAEKDETIAKTNSHSWGGYKVTKNPTCTAAGEEKRSCSRCGHEETKVINALRHSFSHPTVTKEPTCTETGIETGKCSRCGQTTSNTIKAKGHKFGAWADTKPATCTEGGTKERKCSACGAAETKTTDALGHDFENPTIVKAATISETGLKEGKCKRCGQTTSEVIPCSATDEATGTLFEASEGVFAAGTQLTVEEIKTDNPTFDSAKNILKDISGEFKLYNIAATLGGAETTPNGEVKTSFNIPDGYGKDIALYLIKADGTSEKIDCDISEDGKTLTAKLTALGDYAICKLGDGEKADADNASDSIAEKTKGNTALYIIIAAAIIIIAGGITAFVFIKKKKK